MRRFVKALLVTAAVTAALPAPLAAASVEKWAVGDSSALCRFTASFVLDPGPVMDTPRTFDFATVDELPDEPGDFYIHCEGQVNGSKVTGRGTYIERGTIYNGTCSEGSGDGFYEAWIPTEQGVQHLKGRFDLQYVGLAGSETGPTIDATFEFAPTTGNCDEEDPLTGFVLTQQQTLHT